MCQCLGHHHTRIEPGGLRWFWRCLRRPSELCEDGQYYDGGYERTSRRHTVSTLVVCLRCLATWRTSAQYADRLRDATAAERADIVAGVRRGAVSHQLSAVSERTIAERRQKPDWKARAVGS